MIDPLDGRVEWVSMVPCLGLEIMGFCSATGEGHRSGDAAPHAMFVPAIT
jgi:hypothetical protein